MPQTRFRRTESCLQNDKVARFLIPRNSSRDILGNFTLNESGEIISLLDATLASCKTISKVAAGKVEVIDKKIVELQALRNLIVTSVDKCNNDYMIRKKDEFVTIL